jgi:glycosyltransferase involved in cell wall biosynthesis
MDTPTIVSCRNIFMVTHYFPSHGGGIERVAGHLTRALVDSHGYRLTWMASSGDAMPPGPAKCLAAPAWNVIERCSGIPFPIWSPGACLTMWREAKAASVIFVHDYLYPGNFLACMLGTVQGKPIVITQHSLAPRRGTVQNVLLSVLNHTLGAWALRRAARVIFVSDAVRNYFETVLRFTRPPVTIPNGVDTALFCPASEERRDVLRAQFGVQPEDPLLLFVGRFVKIKGFSILKDLAREMGSCQWFFVGDGPIDPAEWQLPNVRVLRNLPQQDLVPLYQAADMLVLPSRGEGFPLVVQEAMSCGTPVMVSPDTAAAFRFEDGLVRSADIEGSDVVRAWKAHITEALSDRSLRHEIRSRIAAYAREAWSWEKCAAAYDAVFASCFNAEESSG